MLSAANLLALEDAGFCFIVGSRTSKAPYDLADALRTARQLLHRRADHRIHPADGHRQEARDRRVVYQCSFKRSQHDNRAINAMVERAENVAAGERPLKKDRFVTITDADQQRGLGPGRTRPPPRRAEGLRHQHRPRHDDGARSSPPTTTSTRSNALPDGQVRPGRPADVPPPTRQHRGPPDHRVRRARRLPRAQARTGLSINKIVKTLRPLRTATITSAASRSPRHRASPPTPNALLDDLARVVTKPIQLRRAPKRPHVRLRPTNRDVARERARRHERVLPSALTSPVHA